MRCPECKSNLKEVRVKIQDADSLVTSHQCMKCGYFDFEDKSMKRAISEVKVKESPLKIKQRIIKLSQDRLGMYFNRDVARCLSLKGGDNIFVTVPDKRHILIEIGD
ncbi:MAG: hypothetical protein KJ709_08695 [Nanoarchaeota archaeon]|nr:hypothetical protein [Nanoarchaeota archaeon]